MDPKESGIGRLGQTLQMREIARLFSVVEGERRYFQELASNLPQGLAIFDARSVLVWSNEAFRRQFSKAAALSEVLPAASLRVAAKKILDGDRAPHIEQIEQSGHALRFTLSVHDNWAAEIEMLVMVEDLTAPVDAARQEAAAQYAPLAAITWELDATRMEFLRVDRAAAERLDLDGELWNRGRSFWSRRLSAEDLARLRSLYQGSTGSITCEYRVTDKAGRTRWLRDVANAANAANVVASVANVANVAEGRIAGVTEDITERHDREQTAQRAARIAAQRALASTVAHENNNLLMILQGYGEDLLQGLPPDSPLQANVREIVAASERLAVHTRTLAAYTAKQPPPAPERFVLDVHLGQRREALMTALLAGAELFLDPASAKARVHLDPAQFTECLRALVASLRGSVRIATERGRGETVQLTVTSTSGNKVPENVFEVSTNPTIVQGPALHAAYEFLRASGADIVVRETGYEILLPRIPDAPIPPPVKDVILVVDDEESIRSLIRKVLERDGYRVLEAASGAAAIQASADHAGPIGLLLSDVVMPGMSGVELAENLSLRRQEMRTLLISGFTGEAALASAKLPRGFEFLQKPFSLPVLLGKVRMLLEQAKGV